MGVEGTRVYLESAGERRDRVAPTPTLDAFTSTVNWDLGSGCTRVGADTNLHLSSLNALSAASFQVKKNPLWR